MLKHWQMRVSVLGLLAMALLGCDSSSNKHSTEAPTMVNPADVSVSELSGRKTIDVVFQNVEPKHYVVARVSGSPKRKNPRELGLRMTIEFWPGYSSFSNGRRLNPLTPSILEAFKANPGAEASPDRVYALGEMIATQTLCQAASIRPDSWINYSNADLAKIAAANDGRIIEATRFPKSVKARNLPAARFEQSRWIVTLKCTAK